MADDVDPLESSIGEALTRIDRKTLEAAVAKAVARAVGEYDVRRLVETTVLTVATQYMAEKAKDPAFRDLITSRLDSEATRVAASFRVSIQEDRRY